MPLPPANASLIDPDTMVSKMLHAPAPPFAVTLSLMVVFTLVATESIPVVEPCSQIRGSSGRFLYVRWRVESCTVFTAVMPASNRILFVNGFVHESDRRRFGRFCSEK